MVTDYEQAWIRLQAVIAEKSQHGRAELLCEMARLADECRVPSGELAKLLRLYGVEVERARSIATESIRGETVPSGADGVRDGMPRSPATTILEGGHDGHEGSSGGRGVRGRRGGVAAPAGARAG